MKVHFIMGRRVHLNNRLGAFVNLEYDDNDSVRTSNEGLVYKKFLEDLSGDFITEEINKEFEVVITISNVKRMRQTVTIDYGRLVPSVPLWIVDNCMNIYRALKKEIRKKHDAYLENEERKAKLRQEQKESNNGLSNSEESH
jgi:hypothetical protein